LDSTTTQSRKSCHGRLINNPDHFDRFGVRNPLTPPVLSLPHVPNPAAVPPPPPSLMACCCCISCCYGKECVQCCGELPRQAKECVQCCGELPRQATRCYDHPLDQPLLAADNMVKDAWAKTPFTDNRSAPGAAAAEDAPQRKIFIRLNIFNLSEINTVILCTISVPPLSLLPCRVDQHPLLLVLTGKRDF
jgi:hypothetical protein